MKTFLTIIFLLAALSAHAFKVESNGKHKVLHFDLNDDASFELYNSIAAFLNDPLEERKTEFSGKNYYVREYIYDSEADMDFSYEVKLTLDPKVHNLKIEKKSQYTAITFEGSLASLILKGLYFRRALSEEFYEMSSGKYYGDYGIKTTNGLINCKYDTRGTLPTEKFAECIILVK